MYVGLKMIICSAFVYTRGAGHDIEYCIELCPALTVSGQIATFLIDDEDDSKSKDDRIAPSV